MKRVQTLLLLLLFMSASAFAIVPPKSVQVAFQKSYPGVTEVFWTQDSGYYVADFQENDFETKVWFADNGRWTMKQTDWETMDEASPAVYNAFAACDFAGWEVQNVTYVQFPQWEPITVVQVGEPNAETRYLLYFTPEGRLYNTNNVTYEYNFMGAGTFL